MDAWIRDLITASVNGVKALADAAWQRIQWVYNVIVAVGLGVRTAWGALLGTVRFKLGRLLDTTREAYLTLYWLTWIRVPQSVNYVIDLITQWVATLLVELRQDFEAGFDVLIDWAARQLNMLFSLIGSVRDWAVRELAAIINVLDFVADLVFTLLTSPQRMAKWLLGALFAEAVSFADDHADMLIDWIQRRSIYYVGRAAARIEDVLVRLL